MDPGGRTRKANRGGEREAVPEALAPDTRVDGYVIRELISSGGFGTVYRAEEVVQGRRVALKVLHRELSGARAGLERFRREAQTLHRLRHENIVEILGSGELPDGRPYYAMELLEGVDLERHLRARGPLPAVEVLAILEPLCEALAAGHEKGVVHRDVKAANVFLAEREGRTDVVLLDFGIAKLLEGGGGELTTSLHQLGTPSSMAPEQISGGAVDARTDVYALGVLTFQMLTGELPFRERSASRMRYLHLRARRPRPSSRVSVPPALDEVVVRAMATEPARRYDGPRAFLAAFRDLGVGSAAGRPPEGVAEPPGRAVAVHVAVQVEPAELEDPDPALLADLGAAVPLAVRFLEARGFQPALESTGAAVLARPLPEAPEAESRSRARAVEDALLLREVLDRRPGRDERVHVNVCLHAAEARGVMRLGAWVPEGALAGVVGSPAAFKGLAFSTEPVASPLALLRVRAR